MSFSHLRCLGLAGGRPSELAEVADGELKNEGKSHDVVENTCRKNVHSGLSHDVDENKGTYLIEATMFMKKKDIPLIGPAAKTVTHSMESILTEREASNFRQSWWLRQALATPRQGAPRKNDIKNEGRSKEVIENKRPRDAMLR